MPDPKLVPAAVIEAVPVERTRALLESSTPSDRPEPPVPFRVMGPLAEVTPADWSMAMPGLLDPPMGDPTPVIVTFAEPVACTRAEYWSSTPALLTPPTPPAALPLIVMSPLAELTSVPAPVRNTANVSVLEVLGLVPVMLIAPVPAEITFDPSIR